MTVMLMLVLSAFSLTMLAGSALQVREAQASGHEFASRHIAEAGFQLGLFQVRSARDLATLLQPFSTIDGLDPDAEEGAGHFSLAFEAQPIIDSEGNTIGEVDVWIDVGSRAEEDTREVTIAALGYVPSKSAYEESSLEASRTQVRGTLDVSFGKAQVFNYAYFIDRWGKFYGNNIFANGSVRSNGQFDFGGGMPTVNGSPIYDSSDGTDLIGYRDDNGDGLEDGNDGGIYSGWAVMDSGSVQGMGGNTSNQHAWQEQLNMPTLSELSIYETQAAEEGGSLSIGGSQVVSGVLGDDAGEPQHLYLEGTAANPIVLDGTVVVRGDVIIKGVVKGQGAIYSGRNTYIAGDFEYANPPTTARPSSNDEATTEAWLVANQDKDAVGLFARENVIIGDYTDGNFAYYVEPWLDHPSSETAEDLGADGIPNTYAGVDGVVGTDDDDVLEGDGEWTVDYYTAVDAAAGRIPAGYSPGDPIPGTGEDLDGDGVQDARIGMSDFEIQGDLSNSAEWAGNLPSGVSQFSDVSTIYIGTIEASFYTNHYVSGLMFNFGDDIRFNGAVVGRASAMVMGGDTIEFNHDPRLLGADVARAFGVQMPVEWEPMEVLTWSYVDSSISIEP